MITVIPWNDAEIFAACMRRHRGEFAAVIMAPIMWEKIRTGDPDVVRAAIEVHIRDAASLYRLPYESPTTQGTSLPSLKGEPPSHPRPTRLRKGRL